MSISSRIKSMFAAVLANLHSPTVGMLTAPEAYKRNPGPGALRAAQRKASTAPTEAELFAIKVWNHQVSKQNSKRLVRKLHEGRSEVGFLLKTLRREDEAQAFFARTERDKADASVNRTLTAKLKGFLRA